MSAAKIQFASQEHRDFFFDMMARSKQQKEIHICGAAAFAALFLFHRPGRMVNGNG